MSGNSIGKLFTVTTFGESHGVGAGRHSGWVSSWTGAY